MRTAISLLVLAAGIARLGEATDGDLWVAIDGTAKVPRGDDTTCDEIGASRPTRGHGTGLPP